MPLSLSLIVACATLTCAQVAAQEAPEVVAAPSTPETPEVAETTGESTDVKLVAFDGAYDFMKTSRRLRILREEVSFDMTVDAQGEATDCKVIDRFRKTYVNDKLCEVAMAHYTFEPARNAQNEPIEGSYRAKLSYAELRAELE